MDALAFVINKHAYSANNAKEYIDALKAHHIPLQIYETAASDLNDVLRQVKTTHRIILVGGGDGTLRSAAQFYANTEKVIGLIPLGTMNHLAKELGIPFDPKTLAQAIKNKTIDTIDLAQVNEHVFMNNSSIGFYPKFVKHRDYYAKFYNKWLSYIISFHKTFKKQEVFSISVRSHELNISLNTSFFMVSNNQYVYEFPASLKRDDFHKQMLGIYYLKHGKLFFSRIFHYFINRRKSFEILDTRFPLEVNVHNQNEVMVSLDGDSMTMQTPLHFKILPAALKILIHSS